MPIQFDCPHCSRLIQTPDGTEGKQAKCPSCGNLARIPAAKREFDGIDVAPTPSHSSFADSNYFRDDDEGLQAKQPPQLNPYATPQSTQSPLYRDESALPRTGPPWERDGKSIESLKDTLVLTLTNPQQMFSTMRLTGNLGAALGMLALVSFVLGIIGAIYQQVFAQALGNFGNFGNVAFQQQAMTAFSAVVGIIIGPFAAIVGAFIGAGIVHLFLLLFQAANQTYETTLRTYCYVLSAATLCGIIPVIGGFVHMIVAIVYLILGLTHAHEAPSGRVAAAVLAPGLVCCALCGGFMVFGFMASGAPAFR